MTSRRDFPDAPQKLLGRYPTVAWNAEPTP
ncbi:MAG: hypothetical protein QOI15_460 [Pseudonocardiales bacterium]|jgi:hypothetical protein|nr:hypothetical protein [Pseudonocardiales bacterium]MDT4919558.1 hypothetical protein [Pseudonocardiales bacterium]